MARNRVRNVVERVVVDVSHGFCPIVRFDGKRPVTAYSFQSAGGLKSFTVVMSDSVSYSSGASCRAFDAVTDCARTSTGSDTSFRTSCDMPANASCWTRS